MADQTELDPTAQGQNEQDVQEAVQQEIDKQEAAPAPQVEAEVIPKQRFEEVYAKLKERERQIDKLLETNNTLAERVAVANAPKPQQQDPDPLDDMDPAEAERTRRIIEAVTRPLKEELQALRGHTVKSQLDREWDEVASLYDDQPQVIEKAKALYATWQKNGYTGWRPADAIPHALGMLAHDERVKTRVSRDEKGRFNTAPTAISRRLQPRGSVKEVDPDTLSPDEALAYWEKKTEGKVF